MLGYFFENDFLSFDYFFAERALCTLISWHFLDVVHYALVVKHVLLMTSQLNDFGSLSLISGFQFGQANSAIS